MEKEKELFEPVMLCSPDGSLNRESVGWSRQPLHTCNLSGRWPRKKKWNYWAITTEGYVFSIALANVDYIGLAFGYFVVWQILRIPRLDDLAGEVEKRKDLQEMLRAGFEFARDGKAAARYSPALVEEVIHRAVRSIDGLRVRFLFLDRKDMALIPFAYGGLVILLLIAMFNPSAFVNAGRCLTSPGYLVAL